VGHSPTRLLDAQDLARSLRPAPVQGALFDGMHVA